MRLAVIGSLALLLASCESGLYNIVSENKTDPSIAQPEAGRFASLSGIPVQWNADKNADQYVVYRRLLTSPVQTVVYQGTDLNFVDTSTADDTLYLYSLSKIRGQKQFTQGAYALGAWDTHYVADPNGANDTKDTAKPFGTTTVSDSIFYYAGTDAVSGQLEKIDDNDWYYVDLGPKLQLFFIFSYSNAAQSGQLTVTTTTDTNVANNDEVSVFNPDVTTQRIWFNVHYNTGIASSSTQTRVDYQLQFKNISNYVPAS